MPQGSNKDVVVVFLSFGVFIVNFGHVWHLFLVFLLISLNREMFARIVSQFETASLPGVSDRQF